MIGYKAFNPDFTCRDKQYAPNATYHEPPSTFGMCFSLVPTDVFLHYPNLLDNQCRPYKYAQVSTTSPEPIGDFISGTAKTHDLSIDDELSFRELTRIFADEPHHDDVMTYWQRRFYNLHHDVDNPCTVDNLQWNVINVRSTCHTFISSGSKAQITGTLYASTLIVQGYGSNIDVDASGSLIVLNGAYNSAIVHGSNNVIVVGGPQCRVLCDKNNTYTSTDGSSVQRWEE